MSAFVPLSDAVMPAWRRLQAALDDHDYNVPCTSAPEVWSGDAPDPEFVTLAENACKTCPAIAACASYADVAGERGAVWGGRYRAKARPNTSRVRVRTPRDSRRTA